jgi:chromosome segregation ATPase
MSMTREEAAYYYKKSEQAYFDAKIGRNNAENALASYNSQKKSTESSLSSSKSEKKNLEARLEDIRIIISLLENSVSLQISKANHAAEMAGEKYVLAIKCSEITNASIQDAYRTKSVEEDINSANTYQSCLNEKTRLETAIENLRIQIQNLNNKIDLLNTNIRSAANTYSNYDNEMKSCQRKARYYYSFM